MCTLTGLMPLQALRCVQGMLGTYEDARSDARLIVCHVLGCDLGGLLMQQAPLTTAQAQQVQALVARRKAHEPVQYLLGEAYFYGRRFSVTPDVLIPRFDSESMLAWVVQHLPPHGRVVDVCTGSGCLAVTLKLERPDAQVCASDISAAALRVARQNADALGAEIAWTQGDLLQPFEGRQFDCILANPPYIPTADLQGLQVEVAAHEPRLALDGGADGLVLMRELVRQAKRVLRPGGQMCVEIGCEQGEQVAALFAAHAMTQIEIHLDMQRRPRFVTGTRKEERA